MGNEVDVTPTHLHDAGEAITGLREGVAESNGFEGVSENGQKHYGMDDAGRLSGGFFNPSLAADEYLLQRSQELIEAQADIEQNLFALASALHIVADVYTSADLEEAVEFAFVDSDTAPASLPAYVDPDQTYSSLREEAEQEGQEAAADGGAGGEAPAEGGESGHSETQVIRPDPRHPSPPTHFTQYYDADGNPTHSEYTTYHSDGSQRVVTYEDGEKVSDETLSPGIDDAVDRQLDEGNQEMEQALREAGLDPDNPDGW